MIKMINSRRAFTLSELAIVLGVVGVILGGVWTAVSSGRQSAKISQSIEGVTETVENIRSLYQGRADFTPNPVGTGGYDYVVPRLVTSGTIPQQFIRPASTACYGAPNTFYADSPLAQTKTDPCGTYRICAWSVGVNTACPSLGSGIQPTQFFAIEFAYLNYGSCIALASTVSPNAPTGLQDVYINGNSGIAAANQLPVTSTFASTNCTKTNTNIIDLLYSLRAPSS